MQIDDFDFLQDLVDNQEKIDKVDDPAAKAGDNTPPEDDETDDNSDDAASEPGEDTPPKEGEDSASKDDDSEGEDYEPYFNFLKNEGVIKVSDDFKFDGTEESFAKAIEESKQIQYQEAVQELWGKLPEQGKPLLNYFLQGGTDVNKFINAYTELDYDNIDLEDEENQIKVLREYYREIFKYNDEKTNKLLARLQDKEALKEGALDAVEDLKEHKKDLQAKLIEEAKKEQEDNQKAAAKERKMIADSIKEMESGRQSKIEAMIFNPVKTESGVTTEFNYYLSKISDSPKHLVQLADLLLDYHPEKGFNLDRFEQRVMSSKAKSLKALIDSKSSPKKSTSQGAPSPKSEEKYFPFDKFLNN